VSPKFMCAVVMTKGMAGPAHVETVKELGMSKRPAKDN
jgi:hypothetical protein